MLALILALMMAFTTLVMPALAAGEDEGIMPRKPAYQCSYCGGGAERVKQSGQYDESFWLGCSEYGKPHEHTYAYVEDVLVCLNTQHLCGKTEPFGERQITSEYCNGANVYIFR